jgi:hypothetical protein
MAKRNIVATIALLPFAIIMLFIGLALYFIGSNTTLNKSAFWKKSKKIATLNSRPNLRDSWSVKSVNF